MGTVRRASSRSNRDSGSNAIEFLGFKPRSRKMLASVHRGDCFMGSRSKCRGDISRMVTRDGLLEGGIA